MGDGPKPLKDFKPAKKVPTAADQFNTDHQGQHEARAKQSASHVDRVHQHNATTPELIDELDKRRSAIRVRIEAAKGRPSKRTYNYRCSTCEKLRQISRLKNKKIKYPCRTKYRKSRINKLRLNKKKQRPKKSLILKIASTVNSVSGNSRRSRKSSVSKELSNSVVVSTNPNTSRTTILSSYHSFGDKEHEPMV